MRFKAEDESASGEIPIGQMSFRETDLEGISVDVLAKDMSTEIDHRCIDQTSLPL